MKKANFTFRKKKCSGKLISFYLKYEYKNYVSKKLFMEFMFFFSPSYVYLFYFLSVYLSKMCWVRCLITIKDGSVLREREEERINMLFKISKTSGYRRKGEYK